MIAVTLPLIPLFMVLIGWRTQVEQRRQWEALQTLSNHFLDVLRGLVTLKVFGRARGQARAIAEVDERYRRRTMRVLRVAFLSSFTLELLATVSVAIVPPAVTTPVTTPPLTAMPVTSQWRTSRAPDARAARA